MTLSVLLQAGCYHCGECGQPLRFEPAKVTEDAAFGIGYCANDDGYSNITGELLRKGCSRANIRVTVPLQILQCELVAT